MKFDGRVAIVTGAGSGIGAAAAFAFASEGANVVLVDQNELGASAVAGRIRNIGRPAATVIGDVADPETADKSVRAAQDFGGLDFLFNNAGIELIESLEETKDNDWDRVINVNLKGTFLFTRACVKVMSKAGGGVIVNNASEAGLKPSPKTAAYSASKAGVIALTRSTAREFARRGVRCNCICPGSIETPLLERFNAQMGKLNNESGPEALKKYVEDYIPMRRVGTPEEVSSVVLFLCSAEAAYLTGLVVPVDGGTCA